MYLETVELDLEISGDFSRGTSQHYSRSLEQYLPGDVPSVENFKVTMNGHDVTKLLRADVLEKLKQDFIEDQLSEMESA